MEYILSLKEKCKLVCWMEAFECAEMVQCKFNKQFNKVPPSGTFITNLHEMFMATGSVLSLKSGKGSELLFNADKAKNTKRGLPHICVKSKPSKVIKYDTIISAKSSEADESEESSENKKEVTKVEDYAEISLTGLEDGTTIWKFQNSHSAEEQQFCCGECSYVTSSKTDYTNHCDQHTIDDPFECSDCNFKCNNSQQYRLHTRNCKAFHVLPDGKLLCRINNDSHQSQHICNICNKVFTTNVSLNIHKMQHVTEKTHVCNLCNFKFLSLAALRKHSKLHNKTKHQIELHCSLCEFDNNDPKALHVHIQTHKETGTLVCGKCQFECPTAAIMEKHTRIHSPDGRTYSCSYCNFSCMLKGRLQLHVSKRHKQNTPHICNKTFAEKKEIALHIGEHTKPSESDFECPFCEYQSTDMKSMRIHLAAHTGSK